MRQAKKNFSRKNPMGDTAWKTWQWIGGQSERVVCTKFAQDRAQ